MMRQAIIICVAWHVFRYSALVIGLCSNSSFPPLLQNHKTSMPLLCDCAVPPTGAGRAYFLSHGCRAGPVECHNTETLNVLEWFCLASCTAAIHKKITPRIAEVLIDPQKIWGTAQTSAFIT